MVNNINKKHKQADLFVPKQKEYSTKMRVYMGNASWLPRPLISNRFFL